MSRSRRWCAGRGGQTIAINPLRWTWTCRKWMCAVISRIWAAIWPVTLLWLVLLAIALWRDATWPTEGTRQTSFTALCVVVTFLLLVSTLMLRRMHGWDWLTISLAAAFATTSLTPFYLMAAT